MLVGPEVGQVRPAAGAGTPSSAATARPGRSRASVQCWVRWCRPRCGSHQAAQSPTATSPGTGTPPASTRPPRRSARRPRGRGPSPVKPVRLRLRPDGHEDDVGGTSSPPSSRTAVTRSPAGSSAERRRRTPRSGRSTPRLRCRSSSRGASYSPTTRASGSVLGREQRDPAPQRRRRSPRPRTRRAPRRRRRGDGPGTSSARSRSASAASAGRARSRPRAAAAGASARGRRSPGRRRRPSSSRPSAVPTPRPGSRPAAVPMSHSAPRSSCGASSPRSAARRPAGEVVLRQRRPVVRAARLGAEHAARAREPDLARRADGGQARPGRSRPRATISSVHPRRSSNW